MTDAAAQQSPGLPVDASPPPERLGPSGLLAVAAVVLLLHLALVVVFTPLAPEKNEAGQAGHSAYFVSSPDPDFLRMADIYDPVAFLHPPAEVGFSFFQANRNDFALDAPTTPVPVPPMFAALEQLPPLDFGPVVRPLVRYVAETDAYSDEDAAPADAVSPPYCVADSRPDVKFPAIPLDTQSERILRRSPPARPSVFVVKSVSAELPSASGASAKDDPFAKVVLAESCGSVELDLAARAWLDTLVNSQAVPESLRLGDKCRVIWSVKALGKEPSVR